ncbi:MAG TPA: hypothetical protein DHV36_02105 [Desulfobacteraceae bacterium]|nr:hypothetical protein [Desulfobacteraceae bacterium]
MKIWLSLWLVLLGVSGAWAQEMTLKAAVPANFPPQYSLTRDGKPTGFAIEVMDRVAALAGFEIQYMVKPTWNEVFESIKKGEADIIPNLGITPEREQHCRFSLPVDTFYLSLFVRTGSLWDYERDKNDHDRVGVAHRNLSMTLLEKYPQVDIVVFNDPEEALFQGLLAGRVEALLYPEQVILRIAKNAGVPDRIRTAGPPLREIKGAIAVCPAKSHVMGDLNRAVEHFVDSPEYKEIFLRWNGVPESFWNPASVAVAMGVCAALAVVIMFLWRYQSIRSLNRRLQKSTLRYRTLVRLSPVGLFRCDAAGNCLWVNEKWKKMAGMSGDQAQGRGWEAAVHPDDKPRVSGLWQQALKEKKSFEAEYRFQRPDGSVTWLTGRAVPEKDGQGRILGYIGTITDITRRKNFEQALQGVLDALPLNIAVLSPAGRVTATNSRWDAFSRENGGDLSHTGVGINYFDACRNAGEEVVVKGLEAIRDRTADIFIWEYPCDSPSEKRWYLLWVIPLEDGSGGLVVSHMDITKRRLAENALEKHRQDLAIEVQNRTRELEGANEELRRNEERLAALLKLSLMVDKTEKEIVDFALEEAVRLTGSKIGYLNFLNPDQETIRLHTWPRTSLEENPAANPSHDPASEIGCWKDCLKHGNPVIHNDNTCTEPKAGPAWGQSPACRHMSVPVYDGGKAVAVAGVGNRKAPYVETDANRLKLFMATMWSILQRQRMENNLQTAKKVAEEASRTKSEFISHMSHELRTPLNGIYGFFQLIATKMDRGNTSPEKLREMVEQGMASSRHLISIVNDLLDLSRIEAGRIDFDFASLKMNEVLDQMQSRMNSLVVQKGLTFRVKCLEADICIRADRKYLDQVLFNLVGNAIKFTHRGHVEVSCHRLDSSMAEVVVSDTGCGIAPGDLPKIFDRFEMIGGRKRPQEGTGLGLTISKKLVELMGGRIYAKSKPGRGSSFHFTLPLIRGPKEGNDAESNDR